METFECLAPGSPLPRGRTGRKDSSAVMSHLSHGYVVPKVAPPRIHLLDQLQFPRSIPVLDLPFTYQGRLARLMLLVPNQHLDPVLAGARLRSDAARLAERGHQSCPCTAFRFVCSSECKRRNSLHLAPGSPLSRGRTEYASLILAKRNQGSRCALARLTPRRSRAGFRRCARPAAGRGVATPPACRRS